MRRSFGSILTSSSSASGSTATVAVEVWMRPCDSVTGTRGTRCTPRSYLSRLKTRSPLTVAIISFTPPASDSDTESGSTFQPHLSA